MNLNPAIDKLLDEANSLLAQATKLEDRTNWQVYMITGMLCRIAAEALMKTRDAQNETA